MNGWVTEGVSIMRLSDGFADLVGHRQYDFTLFWMGRWEGKDLGLLLSLWTFFIYPKELEDCSAVAASRPSPLMSCRFWRSSASSSAS